MKYFCNSRRHRQAIDPIPRTFAAYAVKEVILSLQDMSWLKPWRKPHSPFPMRRSVSFDGMSADLYLSWNAVQINSVKHNVLNWMLRIARIQQTFTH